MDMLYRKYYQDHNFFWMLYALMIEGFPTFPSDGVLDEDTISFEEVMESIISGKFFEGVSDENKELILQNIVGFLEEKYLGLIEVLDFVTNIMRKFGFYEGEIKLERERLMQLIVKRRDWEASIG